MILQPMTHYKQYSSMAIRVLFPSLVSLFCLRAALESLGIPCFLGGMARGMLGRESALHIRQNRREALKEADLVILAGGVLVRSAL